MKHFELIYGIRAGRSGEVIGERISSLVSDRKACLCIVPEQQTVIAEAAMAKRLPSYAPLCFEVTNFSRLAETVFRRFGGISYNYASDTSRTLIMWRTLAELSPIISEFSYSDPGSVTSALSAISELRSRDVRASDLERAAGELPDSTLKKKLNDLSLIGALSGAMLREHYDDSFDDLDRLAELIISERAFEGYHIFVDGFVSLTAQEYRVIRALISQCDVTLTLPLPHPATEGLQFAEPLRFEAMLRRIAQDASASVAEIISSQNEPQNAAMKFADTLGGDTQTEISEGLDGLRVVRAEDPYKAAEFVACDILGKIQDEGAHYSDFAVIVRDASKYRGIIDAIFERQGIPCFFSAKTDLTSLEPVKLIRSAYSVISGGWRAADVIAFLKCGLSGISPNACDEFEDYVSKWHINGSRFTDGTAWNMNPDGYTSIRTDYGNSLLVRVNQTREYLVSLLTPFSDAIDNAATVRDHCVALYEFMTALALPDKLLERADDAALAGDADDAEEYRKLWKLICDLLDTLCDVLAEVDADGETFTRLLDLIFRDASLGHIPTYCDQVIIGAADMIRVDQPKKVYIIGANKDEFPRAVSDSGLFGDSDRETLRRVGLDVGEDVAFLSSRELFYFYRALSFASESTDIIYTSYGNLRSPCEPTSELAPLLRADSPVQFIDASALPADYYIRSETAARERRLSGEDANLSAALAKLFGERGEGLTRSALAVGECSLSKETASRLFGGNIALTQSRITAFTECPFRHFGRYVLKLEPTEAAEINYRDIGNYIHRLLEVFFRTLNEEGRHLRDIPTDELPGIAEEITNKYIDEICPDGRSKTARLIRLFERLSRSALVILRELHDEFTSSEFDPALFELSLEAGDEQKPSPLRIPLAGGGDASVYGVIDRVDKYQKDGDVYIRVVDYKSGSHKFSAKNIASGNDLQLIIYLMALTSTDKTAFKELLGCAEKGRLLPAGAIYFTSGGGDRVVESPSQAGSGIDTARRAILRSGVVLSDPDIIYAMEGESRGKYLPIKEKSNGELEKASDSLLLSLDGMTELFSDVSAVIAEIGANMRAGNINTAGHVTQTKKRDDIAKRCDSCPIKPICRKPVHK